MMAQVVLGFIISLEKIFLIELTFLKDILMLLKSFKTLAILLLTKAIVIGM